MNGNQGAFGRAEGKGRRQGNMATVDFWYSIGSTYSYLTVMRLPGVARASGIAFRWRPFNVRHVMVVQNNIPFKDKPVKTAYMWRDIQRRAVRYGLTPIIPAPYPLPGLVYANQVAILGADEGWGEDYTRATYRRWFESGQPAGEEPNLSESLAEIGQDPLRVLHVAKSDRIEAELNAATREAMALGVFGTPSFVVEGELFWGDDRLEDALDWARSGKLS
jgi:2-hydroxychromene-2-carboxylate isomerase